MKLFLHIANFKLMRTYNGTLLGKFFKFAPNHFFSMKIDRLIRKDILLLLPMIVQ